MSTHLKPYCDNDWDINLFNMLLLLTGVPVEAKQIFKQKAEPLLWSCWNGHALGISELLEAANDVRRCSALMVAAFRGQTGLVKLILHRGYATAHHSDCLGRTALLFACVGGHLNIMDLLIIWGSSIWMQDEYGRSQ